MANKSIKRQLTNLERNNIYNQMIIELSNNGYDETTDDGIKKIKIIAKLFRDTKREDSGKINLKCGKTIVYQLYNNFSKKTQINIINTPCKNFYENENIDKQQTDNVPNLIATE
ncbi:hypothetical protein BMW23_0974 [Bodo saltans virus]|jgi:hypothetical protein|uniref:Uncharacterized protein n=1 Tax=Bodo saltans virus TaxID=2024608 RepID=A0A2H4UWF6_9VIRU|nr:hypothetical protein QJ851_gp0956 [Bodo saltans virus]ATZ81019.1 hypothetical protein BMW23_0974 [Bodo saltans virus]